MLTKRHVHRHTCTHRLIHDCWTFSHNCNQLIKMFSKKIEM